jgi:D-ribulokinase
LAAQPGRAAFDASELAAVPGQPAVWLVGGASNTGGAVLRHVFGAESDELLSALSERIDPGKASGLDYYPLVKPGERFPVCDPGLQPRMTPRPQGDDALFLQGLLEGMSRVEQAGYAALAQRGAPPLRRVLSCGGGARNEVWTAMRGRMLGVPVERAGGSGEASYGAALLARRALL